MEAEAAGLLLPISRCAGHARGGWAWAADRLPDPFGVLLCRVACNRGWHATLAALQRAEWRRNPLFFICREPGAAQALAAAGAGPTLTVLAASSGSSEAGQLAGETLQNLQQQVGWRQLQLHRQQGARPLQRAASDGSAQPGAAPARPAAQPAWPQHLSKAASAPAPLPPVPEQQALGVGLPCSANHKGQRAGSLDLPGRPGSDNGDAWAKVQRWQEQQAQQGGGTAVAHLVASLSSPIPRNQLAAAEQLAALAASGGRAAAAIAAAGGAHALLACVRDSSASSLNSSGELVESALGPSICTTALRALCTLCQQDTSAAAVLPPAAAAGLQALLVGPDPQQRQLAAMLLGCMQAAGVEPLLVARAHFAQAATHSSGTDVGTDLLQTDQISFLSELPSFASESLSRSTHDNAVLSAEQLPLQPQQQQQLVKQLLPAQATTPATVLYRQHSTDSGGTPPEFSTPSLPGLPSPARRQLSSGGQQPPRHRPPLPGGRPGSSASSTRSHAVLRAQQAQQAQQQASGQFWRPESAASPELASPFGRAHSAISDAFASELGSGGGDLRSSGSGGLAAAAAAERAGSQGSGGSDSLHVQRSDIVICQVCDGGVVGLFAWEVTTLAPTSGWRLSSCRAVC